MPNIAIGNYNTQTLRTPQVQDYASVYVAVGNALNQKYYQNREAYISRIANPLSQMKATVRGQKVLDSERTKIVEGANEFKNSDNWFLADDYIYGATENILTNEGLKAVQNDYALEMAYRDELKKSDWDSQQQNGFLIRSYLQSGEIQYDAENNTVTGGGFNGVHIGKKFDVDKYQKEVFDILSKAKADSQSFESIVTNPNAIRQYGLDVVMGQDGETIASHFVKQGSSREGITEQQIMSYAMTLLNSNPDYKNYLRTTWLNNDALNRFVKDDSVTGGHLREYTLGDYAPLFQANPAMFAMQGLGINLNSLGKVTDTGKFIADKKLSADGQNIVNTIQQRYGVNILDVLNGKSSIPDEMIQQGLQNCIDRMFGNYAISVLGSTDDIESIDKEAWTQNILSQQFIDNNIQQLASTAAGLYSYQKVKTTMDLIANPAYAAYMRAKYSPKGKGKGTETSEELAKYGPYMATLGGMEVTGDSVKENINRRNEATDQMMRLQSSMNQVFTADELEIFGIGPNDKDAIQTLNIEVASRLVDNKGFDEETAANLKGKLLEVQAAQRQYNNLKAKLRADEIQLNSIFDIWKEHRDEIEGNFGWYKVASNQAKLILSERIDNYDKYLQFVNDNYDYRVSYTGQGGTGKGQYIKKTNNPNIPDTLESLIPKDDFENTLANAADNVSNRYRKAIADQPLEFTAVRDIIANPSKYQRDYMDRMKVLWKQGGGNLTIAQSPKGKGSGITPMELAKYIDFDAFPTTITEGAKGITVSRRNTAEKNTTPIDGEELGLDYDIYKTELSPVANGIANKNGYQEYALTLYDKSGTARDNIIISEKMEPSTISRYLLDNYRNIKPYTGVGGELMARNAGMLEAQYSAGYINFDTTNAKNSPFVANIADLQKMVDKLGTVEYNLNISDPLYNQQDGNSRKVEIGKTTRGYYIKDLEGLKYPDGTTHLGEFGYANMPYSLKSIDGMTPGSIQYYDTINEALAPVSEYILSQYGMILDMNDAAEAMKKQEINQSYIGY